MPPFTDEGTLPLEKQEALYRAMRQLPSREQSAYLDLIKALNEGNQEEAFAAVAKAAQRSAYSGRKRRNDHAGNHRRRILVGAQVPRTLAAKCKRAALLDGVSLYRWLVEVLERATSRCEMG